MKGARCLAFFLTTQSKKKHEAGSVKIAIPICGNDTIAGYYNTLLQHKRVAKGAGPNVTDYEC